jgi:crotonobetainyl-CoA:carnitine CoA-transferase CaiB-like acyl-CoA transferase
VALAIGSDDEFDRLVKVLDSEPLSASAFATAGGRFEQRHVLDAQIAEALRTRIARDLAAELRAAGIAAEEVMSAPGLLGSDTLASRDFLTEVEHPAWGRRRLVGVPWRPFGEPALALGPPPLLATLDAPERDR